MANIIIPLPRSRASRRRARTQTQKAPQGAAGGMQAPMQGCRNSEIRKANSDAHHLCLNSLGPGERRQQQPSDRSQVPAEQVWDLLPQPSSTGESKIPANPLGFTVQQNSSAGGQGRPQ